MNTDGSTAMSSAARIQKQLERDALRVQPEYCGPNAPCSLTAAENGDATRELCRTVSSDIVSAQLAFKAPCTKTLHPVLLKFTSNAL